MIPTLRDIRPQLSPGDRLVVVADNCSDNTAQIARAMAIDTIERHDLSKIGKGYALDFGLRHLAEDQPDVVIFIDADCRVDEGAIDLLAQKVSTTGRPAQALYLMTAPGERTLSNQIAEFAWRVKNWVRPLGLLKLGMPCQLVGTGMALPFGLVKSVDLANDALVEDLKLGLDLAALDSAPLFCPEAVITSVFATSTEGRTTQQIRWEQGHLQLIVTAMRSFLIPSVRRRDVNTGVLLLDLSVPPLALLGMLLLTALALASVGASLGGSWIPLYLSLGSLCLLAASLFVAWRRFGRDILQPRAAVAIPKIVIAKLIMYLRILVGRGAKTWLRTDRGERP